MTDTVGFKIHGDYMTEFTRTRVLEGRWDHAFEILFDGLGGGQPGGITRDQVFSILSGDAKLEGVNEVDIFADDAAEYKQSLQNAYAGCYVTSDGRYMRPYAVVTSWGPEDYQADDEWASGRPSRTRSRGNKFAHRSYYYADRDDDVMHTLSLPRDYPLRDGVYFSEYDVLFKEVRNFPVGIVNVGGVSGAQGALNAFLAAGLMLRETGHTPRFPSIVDQTTHRDVVPVLKKTVTAITTKEDVDNLEILRDAAYRADNLKTVEQINAALEQALVDVANTDLPLKARIKAAEDRNKIAERAATKIEDYREAILEQAAGNFIDLSFEVDGVLKTYQVPRAPFECWALGKMNRDSGHHAALPWKAVAPNGLRMGADDAYHNDWMIGAGIDPYSWSLCGGTPLTDAAFDLRGEVQAEKLKFKATVLAGRGSVYGRITHIDPGQTFNKLGKIGIIRNAGPDYVFAAQEAVENGYALITEQGGSVAHLVTVFLDKPLRMVRVKNACDLYREGDFATVDLENGLVTIHAI